MRITAVVLGSLLAATTALAPRVALPGASAGVFGIGVANASRRAASDSQEVADVVARFHAALAAGDSAAALALLADDVAILESGGVESRAEYRSHHLPGDIGFARAVPSRRSGTHVRLRGDVAWVTSTSVTEGEYRGRQVNSSGVELVILSRESDGWRIRAIHWSSRARR